MALFLGRDVEGHGELVATGYAVRGAELVEVFTSDHPVAEVVEGQAEEARADALARRAGCRQRRAVAEPDHRDGGGGGARVVRLVVPPKDGAA